MTTASRALGALLLASARASAWRVCDVTAFGAVGDGSSDATAAIRACLAACDEVVLKHGGAFVSGPLNLTSNQVLRVDGTLLASQEPRDYPLVAPLLGYGWSNDMNCFAPGAAPHKVVVGKLRYAPVVGAFGARNVSVVGAGVIDGRGEPWWSNCTACHYPPHNDSRLCEVATRPKLLEFQFVDGLTVRGASSDSPLTLRDSPFWTLTPSYSQNIRVRDLRILAPMDRIGVPPPPASPPARARRARARSFRSHPTAPTTGNTDGVNLDSCRDAVVEHLYINNSDDGVCMKSGLDGYGMNLAIPTEDVLVRNVSCDPASRCGFAIGSEMSGGVRNVTFRDSVCRVRTCIV